MSDRIPFLDLGRLHGSIRSELDEVIDGVVNRSAFVGGDELRSFEDEFATAHGLAGGAGCGSGTDALALSLRALGIGPGDEVVVPSMTFVATAEAVVHVGATPVVADVDPATLLLTPATVDEVRTDATRAVLPVHLYGNMVSPAHLRAWRDAGLVVVEDAAQAHLATSDGIGVGAVGHAACFSFFPGKNLGAFGDGGMVLAGDDHVLASVRRLRDHGRSTKYRHDAVGWCSRLDGLQAAILRVKLRHLAHWTDGRRRVARRYAELFGDRFLVPWSEGAVHHLLCVRVHDRDGAQQRLGEVGVTTGVHYPIPLSQQPWLVELGARATPVAERAATELLSLPMDPLMSDDEAERVVAALVDVAEPVDHDEDGAP